MTLMAAVAGLVCGRAARYIARSSPLARPNYRGLSIPVAAGIAITIGMLAAAALARFLFAIAPGSERFATMVRLIPGVLAVLLGFGLLGLWDDVAGSSGERGWRAHIDALRRGRASAGALKVIAGAAIAFSVAPGETLAWVIVNGAVIALCANLSNLLDLRPGRASKTFCVLALVMIIANGPMGMHLAAALGATLAFLPLDLRERAMLGDTGSNALGALLGLAITLTAPHMVVAVLLVILVALNAAGQKPGLSSIIRSAPAFRAFDAAGRVKE